MLRCHILELLTVVKGTIQAELPPKLIILFDGCWTVGTHHYYIGIAAAYFKVGADGKEAPVHKILPVNETLHADGSKVMLRATDHLIHVEEVLESFGS